MEKKERRPLYEGMYILSASLSEDARTKALEKLEAGIQAHGGEVLKVCNWGRRRLAYDINDHREGHYYIIYFNVDAGAIAELWQEYHLNEDLVRFITLRTDKVLEKIEFKSLVEA